jgi:hypothetical protein
VQLQFKDWDRDIQITASEARDRIDAIRADLPDDLQRYFVNNFSPSDQPIIRMRFSSNRDLRKEYDLIEREVKRRIERVPGVARVELSGAQPTRSRSRSTRRAWARTTSASTSWRRSCRRSTSRCPPARSTKASAACACSRSASCARSTSCATWC